MNRPFDCISELIFAESEIKKADVILIPGTSQPQLMEKAAELYFKGYAPYILPSGGYNYKTPLFKSEWEYLRTIGHKLGVPDNIILKEDKAQNTFENAQFSWEVLQSLDIKVENVILVCKTFHSRRALMTYQFVFPRDINFYVSPVVDKRGISKDNWFRKEEGIRAVMSETSKIGTYFADKIPVWVR